MDDPRLDVDLHQQALKGLQRINTVSRSWKAIWDPVRQLAKTHGEPVSVVDVACGSGDMLLNMCRRASREDLSIRFTGLDISQTAIQFATDAAQVHDLDIEFRRANASELASGPPFDVVCCSLFLHHLPVAEAVDLLGQMKASANQMVLVQDLRRSTAGYGLAFIVPRLLTRSRIVHIDALRSVRAAFSIDEVHKLAHASGLEHAGIRKVWPQRFLLSWTRNPAANK
jgi:2-polyprenyl-3-methyl-5-hydroxy-6-metoxy-1,4-benzoquinol methylase